MYNFPYTIKKIYETLGIRSQFAGLAFSRLFLCSLLTTARVIDDLVPGSKCHQLDRPIFLIGHLRSGTTFLHRFLVQNCPEIRGAHLWEIAAPYKSTKILLKPLLPILRGKTFDRIYDPDIHRTGPMLPEADDIALSLRFFSGLLSWIYFAAWGHYPTTAHLENSIARFTQDPRFLPYLERLHAVNTHGTGQRAISKSFTLLFQIDLIRKHFHDPKIILLVRDPLDAVPSMLSLECRVQSKLMNFEKNDPKMKQQYIKNIYNMSILYYKELNKKIRTPGNELLVINYNYLKKRFIKTIEQLLDFCQIHPGKNFQKILKDQSSKQNNYTSHHRYSPEDFGLSKNKIQKDFAFIYEVLDEAT